MTSDATKVLLLVTRNILKTLGRKPTGGRTN